MSDVKSRRAEYAELTRNAVLVAARCLFVSVGFDSTSVDDIARMSRVSKGAVYHHFPDKQALFAAVFRASQESVISCVVQATASVCEPWKRAEAAVRSFLRSYVGDPEARVLLRQSASALGQRPPHSMDQEIALPLIIKMLDDLRGIDELKDVSIEPTARIMLGTLCEAATYVASATDPDVASIEAEKVVLSMLGGLRNT